MKNTILLATSLVALLGISQSVFALNEESAGYNLILDKSVNEQVTTHAELSTLAGNLDEAISYGALYDSIARPVANSDDGHGIHQQDFGIVSYMASDRELNDVIVGDPFYYDTSR